MISICTDSVPVRNREHPLTDQHFHLVFNHIWSAVVHKALGKTVHQTDRFVRRPRQQRAGIRYPQTRIERSLNTAT